jgi:hypothetical protein
MEKEFSQQNSEIVAQETARLKLPDSLFFLDNYDLMREGPRSIFLENLKNLVYNPAGCLFHETNCFNLDEALNFLNDNKMYAKEAEVSFSLTPWWWSKRTEYHDRKDSLQMCVMLSRVKSWEIKKAFIADNLQETATPQDNLAKHLFEEYLEIRTNQKVTPKDFSAVFLRLFKWNDLDSVGLKKLDIERRKISSKWHDYLLRCGGYRVNDADLGLYLKDTSKIEEIEVSLVEDYYRKNSHAFENLISIAAQIGESSGVPVFDYYGNLLFPFQSKRRDLKKILS